MNKKILITGASGHLGGMLFRSLAHIGYKPKDSADRFDVQQLSKNEYRDKTALLFQGGVFTSANFKGQIKSIK